MRPEILYPLFRGIENISGVGPRYAKLLTSLYGGGKVVDALFHLPYNIVDRRYSPLIADARTGVVCTVRGKVVEHIAPKTKKQPYKVVIEDQTEQLVLYFFKYYLSTIEKNLPVGEEVVVSGKIELFNGMRQMIHPDYIGRISDFEKIAKVEPIYPLTAGISNKMAEKVAKYALSQIPKMPEWQDENFKKQQNFPDFADALKRLHNPQNIKDIDTNSIYCRRVAYDELLANQLALAISREKIKRQKGKSICGDGKLRKQILQDLGFELTDAQKKALEEIYADQKADFRMLRLLQGDVGSGKTVVALLAMLNTVEAGFQAAIMVPTEILAEQHFETMRKICEKSNICIELLTGRIKGKKREEILQKLKNGTINILIGTHALFVDNVEFHNLALAVIDEQHRFGVQQRLALSAKGYRCDILVMTATPIPRTLVLTSYGDMEYSQIAELPKGRKPVDTRVMPDTKIDEIIAGLQRKLDGGAQGYWVCPLVEESEKSDLAAATARFEMLQKFFGDKVGLVHGKMKDAQKNEIMQEFKSGKLKLLVSTTVIEVGVNVPNATVMVVERAERFGLAQLHQLRGRIKRSSEPGFCVLLYGRPLSQVAQSRLEIMRKTEDGFVIAEEDLKLRGGGEILGVRQSGFESFKVAEMPTHTDLLLTASKDAKLIMRTDNNLHSPRGEALRNLLYLFEKDADLKTYTAG